MGVAVGRSLAVLLLAKGHTDLGTDLSPSEIRLPCVMLHSGSSILSYELYDSNLYLYLL